MSKIIHYSDGSRAVVHPQEGMDVSIRVKGITITQVEEVTKEEAEIVKNEISEAIS